MVTFALGFAIGAWCLQQQANLPDINSLALLCLWLSLMLLGLRHYLSRHLAIRLFSLFCYALCLGFLWAALQAQHRLSQSLSSDWERKDIRLSGVIASIPEYSAANTRFVLDVEQILTPQAQVPTHIALSFYPAKNNETKALPQFHAGQRWQFSVRLKKPHSTYNPNGFDFEAYALSENIRATGYIRDKNPYFKLSELVWQPSYLIAHIRELIGLHIQQTLAGCSYAGVIRGLVIGDDSQISQQQWQTFLVTGTNHLMSISGLHITMLSGLLYALTSMLWRRFPSLVLRLPTHKAASVIGMLTAIVYAALAGFSVPTQRTLYMLMTVAVLLLLGRKVAFSYVLSLALLVVVVLDPWAVISAGFWLSFAAVAVMVFASSGRIAVEHYLLTATRAQWAVTLGLLPALVLMFGQFSLVSPVANAIAIPLISWLVVPLAILGSVFSLDSVLLLAQLVLSFCMWLLDFLAQAPIAVWQQARPALWTVLLASLGIIWMLLPKGLPLRFLGVFCLLPMLTQKPAAIAQGDMQVTVLDVGQGLSVLVRTAQHTLLYDAGPRFSTQSDAGSRIVVPYLRSIGVKHLDGLIVSHDDLDHSGGVPSVLAQLPVDWLASSLSLTSEMFQHPLYLQHLPHQQLKCYAGQHWQWDAVKFEILHPQQQTYQDLAVKDNDRSCVVKVTSASASILLTGDVERVSEFAMLEDNAALVKSDVLIAPHHGSKTSSSERFISAVSPRWVIVSNGYLNRFGHPKPTIVARYSAHAAQVLRSDYDGAVQINFKRNLAPVVLKWRKIDRRYWHEQYP
jgi:competence protein ComEC